MLCFQRPFRASRGRFAALGALLPWILMPAQAAGEVPAQPQGQGGAEEQVPLGALVGAFDEGLAGAPFPWSLEALARTAGMPLEVSRIEASAWGSILELPWFDPARDLGLRLRPSGSGRLTVAGPPEVRAGLRELVAALEADLAPNLSLVWARIPAAHDGAGPAPGLVELDALGTHLENPEARRVELPLAPGRTSRELGGRSTPFLLENAVQIASGSFVHGQVVAHAFEGTAAAARWAPGRDGHWLALRLESSEALGEPDTVQARSSALLNGEEGARFVPIQLPRERQQVLVRGLAFDGFLPRGKALVFEQSWQLACPFGGEMAEGSEFWCLWVEGQGPPVHRRLHPAGAARAVDWVLAEAYAPPRFEWPSGPVTALVGRYDRDLALLAERPTGLLDRLPGSPRDWRSIGPWLVAAVAPGAPTPLSAPEPPAGEAQGLKLRFEVPGEVPGEVEWRGALPAGAHLAALVLRVSPLHADSAVEVAGQVGVDSQTVSLMHLGLAFEVFAGARADAAWSLAAAAVHPQGPSRSPSLGVPLRLPLEFVPLLLIEGQRSLRNAEEGPQTARLGSPDGAFLRMERLPAAPGGLR